MDGLQPTFDINGNNNGWIGYTVGEAGNATACNCCGI